MTAPKTIATSYALADLSNPQHVRLAEGGDAIASIQILRAVELEHPYFGTLKFDKKLFDRLISNFSSGVRGCDLCLDIDHNPETPAQAWLTALRLSEDEKALWADVEWTDIGSENVRNKRYRYVSVEYDPDYRDEKEKKCGATLLGAALTNRPFVKGMAPVLHEPGEKETDMDELKTIREALGLGESATAADILNAVAALKTPPASPAPELSETARKLSETEKALTDLTLSHDNLLKTVQAERAAGAIRKFQEAGKVTPAELDAANGYLRKLAETDVTTFSAMMDARPQIVAFGERGVAGGAEVSPTQALNEVVVAELAELRKSRATATYGDALSLAAQKRPELYAAYRQATV